MDIGQIRGQNVAKFGLAIAAAGRHNILLSGPPGNGKSSLALSIEGFLPYQTLEEYDELKGIYKCIGLIPGEERPIITVNPQVTVSELVGGGHKPTPGSISLAHSGVLFMDEFPEYDKKTLELLRQPLERKSIDIYRGGIYATFLSDFQLIAAMNPCPCGYYTEGILYEQDLINGMYCRCTEVELKRYKKKLSGPILDRIDMFVQMDKVPVEDLFLPPKLGESDDFKRKVNEASNIRMDRNQQGFNSQIGGEETYNPRSTIYVWTKEALGYFKSKAELYSARKLTKLARVSRTIADLLQSPETKIEHVRTASTYVSNSLIG